MPEQYFVIGARYQNFDFRQMIEGTAHVLGPYVNYDDAQRVWQEQSIASRADAMSRYAIVKNAADPLRAQQSR